LKMKLYLNNENMFLGSYPYRPSSVV